jgi:acid stress chaperone HdeA
MDAKKNAGLFLLGLSVALSAPVVAAQSADKTVRPETMTCAEFLVLDKDVQPRVVYWLDGYSQGGAAKTEIVVHSFDRPITVVVDECKKTPKETVWQKIKKFF